MIDASFVAKPDDCFHCGLPLNGATYSIVIDDKSEPMCCLGCQAVAQTIIDNGLDDFYRYRTEPSVRPDSVVPDVLEQFLVFDNDAVQKTFVRQSDDESEASLIVEGVVCAACVWLLEHHLQKLPGVISFRVNLTTHRAVVVWDKQQLVLSQILLKVQQVGYQAHPFDTGRLQKLHDDERKRSLRRIAIAGIGMMQVMMTSLALYVGADSMSESAQQMLRWAGFIITTPVVIFASSIFFKAAWRDLRRKHLGMDVPVSIAILAAFVASIWATFSGTGEVYFDSVTMFTFFLLLGRYLEMSARHQAGKVADELVRLLPATATKVESDGSSKLISVSELELGDVVSIKPGEVVPADGVVLEGRSSVNESMLTGESVPVLKYEGTSLSGGTVNVESPLMMSVEALGEETMLSSIVRLLNRAQMDKPKFATLADSVASWFVFAVLIVSVVVFSVWYVLVPEQAFWVTISVLVVTCPCALSLATPVALTTATSRLTKMGLLTTQGQALETLSKVTHVVFDKTGTLTTGKLMLVDEYSYDANDSQFINAQQRLMLAAGLESASEHPIGKAIYSASADRYTCTHLINVPGKGVEGVYGQESYRIGTLDFISEWIAYDKEFESGPLAINQESLRTIVYLASQDELLAIYYLEDQIRDDAQQTIQALGKEGYQTVLLSGDKPEVAEKVGRKLGIGTVIAGQLPDQKLAYLKKLQAQGNVVTMVGDGVNDAPVLAGADVSIAMGEGSQLAQVSADMVLMSNRLELLPEALRVSGSTKRIILQNLAWALSYNALALPMAVLGYLAPWAAAIGMSFSSVFVVLNALRLRSK
ncbi:heavy metal translocating P-type ATPase [Leucothrix arctica]|uniref:Cation transporter n=1 Tax=Leucothrix arctica TaxID=1481894 RepID=A0A317CM45_9GAMM|nr:heavy metal translocating P-type ATPase [Leucothrix arctica]PWQ98513.1 cation transporter [Leucothrix arctica]